MSCAPRFAGPTSRACPPWVTCTKAIYSHTFEEDRGKLEREGVNVLFAPDERELYPEPWGYQV